MTRCISYTCDFFPYTHIHTYIHTNTHTHTRTYTHTHIHTNTALSAYERYQNLSPESSSNTNFLYGLGLIYFHLRAYDW